MFNQTNITKESATTSKNILFCTEGAISVGVVVSDDDAVTEGSRKFVKAGTPLTGSLEARTTAFTKGSTNAVGILLHDVEVTKGDANGTLLIAGYVNPERIDTTTAALITSEVKTALKGNITFVK